MKKTKLEKGITLIALIITIVVLLILAVVTIGSIRDSKIIGHAQNAATDYKKAQEEEQIMLGYSEYKMSSLKNSNAPLEIEGAKSVNGNKTNGWIVEFESGNTYKLEPNGNIDIYEPVVNEDPNGWDIAFIHNGTSWVDTHVTSPEQTEGAKIVDLEEQGKGVCMLKKSNDSTLKSLAVEGYELYPAFDINTREYNIRITNDITKVAIAPTVNHEKASYKIQGATEELLVGKNVITVIVTAEDGSSSNYVINVTRDREGLNVKHIKFFYIDETGVKQELTLNPVFSSGVFEYDLGTISHLISKLDVDVLANFAEAKIEVRTGNQILLLSREYTIPRGLLIS